MGHRVVVACPGRPCVVLSLPSAVPSSSPTSSSPPCTRPCEGQSADDQRAMSCMWQKTSTRHTETTCFFLATSPRQPGAKSKSAGSHDPIPKGDTLYKNSTPTSTPQCQHNPLGNRQWMPKEHVRGGGKALGRVSLLKRRRLTTCPCPCLLPLPFPLSPRRSVSLLKRRRDTGGVEANEGRR